MAAEIHPPIGTVMAYAGPINAKWESDHGWLVCDGRQLRGDKNSEYHHLAIALKPTNNDQYPWGGEAADLFYLPDLRGNFLRGVMSPGQQPVPEGHGDPDADNRRHSREDLTGPGQQKGNAGNRVGSYQPDALQNHRHMHPNALNAGGGLEAHGDDLGHATVTGEPCDQNGKNLETALETRVRNSFVYWIIRYK